MEGYIITRGTVPRDASAGVIRLARGASVRVHVRGPLSVLGKRPVRLVLIPRVSTGIKGLIQSLNLAGQPSRYSLLGYLRTIDELQDAPGEPVDAEKRRQLMRAWGPLSKSKVRTRRPGRNLAPKATQNPMQNPVQNPYSVADRRFLSLGRGSLICALGCDGSATWDGLPPGTGYRIGILSGVRIRFLGGASPRPRAKPPSRVLPVPPPLAAGTKVSQLFDLAGLENKEILADFVSPEAELRFTMPPKFLPKGVTCRVTVHSLVLTDPGQQITSILQEDHFGCSPGTNHRSLDVEGPVFVKSVWELAGHRFRFRSHAARLVRGEEVHLGTVAWLDGGRVCRLAWTPTYGGRELSLSRVSPVPRLYVACTLILGPARPKSAAWMEHGNTFWIQESIPWGTDCVLEGLPDGVISIFGQVQENQQAVLLKGVATAIGTQESQLAGPIIAPLRQPIGSGEKIVLRAAFTSTTGTEVLLPDLVDVPGTIHAILVGKAVRRRVLKVSASSTASGTRVLGGVVGAYADHAGSTAPGAPLLGHRMAPFDKNGECSMLLPVSSTWTFRLGTLIPLFLKGNPKVRAIHVTAGTQVIELQRGP